MLILGDKIIAGSFKAGASWEVGDVGISAFGIDEALNKRRYLNGQVISQAQFVQFTAMLKSRVSVYPNLATSEVNWQAEVTNSKLGQCGKFVIDDNAGTIRLPKVVNINGLQNLTALGTIKAESLPNIKGRLTSKDWRLGDATPTGPFYRENTGGERPSYGTSGGCEWYFDASRVSSTYQDNAPVQQEAIQYPYFIQVATGVETSVDVSREIELNNPFSLFDFQWSDHLLNNVSWLRADTFSWQDGTVYEAAYNHLVADYTNGTRTLVPEGAGIWCNIAPDGHRIVDASDTTQVTNVENLYSTTGVAWYYILDTTNKRFKLPRTKYGFVGLRDTVGKYVPETLPNITGEMYSGGIYSTYNVLGVFDGSSTGAGTGATHNRAINDQTQHTVFNASNSSSVYQDNAPVQQRATQMYLYFYVGETVQDANIIAAGQALTDIADLKAHSIVETYVNGTSWYRVYSDKWCEQGGYISSASGVYTVTFLKPFADTNYTIVKTMATTSTNTGVTYAQLSFYNRSATSAQTTTASAGFSWMACGYGA